LGEKSHKSKELLQFRSLWNQRFPAEMAPEGGRDGGDHH
jgi:hypothetical protein